MWVLVTSCAMNALLVRVLIIAYELPRKVVMTHSLNTVGVISSSPNSSSVDIAKMPSKQSRGSRRKASEKPVWHNKDLTWIIHNCGYNPAVGYIDWDWVDGIWQPVGKYIKYPKNSNAQQYWKRHSNKIVRKKNEIFRGNQYRKCFDYWWTLY